MRPTIAICRACLTFLVAAFFAASSAAMADAHLDVRPDKGDVEFKMPLAEEWLFEWGVFLSPTEVHTAYQMRPQDFVSASNAWRHDAPKAADNPYRHGIATYARHITMPDQMPEPLMLHVGRLPEAYEIYWVPLDRPEATKLIASEGHLVGPSRAAQIDLSHPFDVTGEGLLLVHLRKDLLAWGGMYEPPLITTAQADNKTRKFQLTLNGFWIGCLFFAALQNFYLFLALPKDRTPLLLGSAAICAIAYLSAISNVLEVIFGSDFHVMRTRLELASIIAIGPILLQTIRKLVNQYRSLKLLRAMTAFGTFGVAFVFFAPSDLMSQYLPLYQAFLVAGFAIAVVELFWAVRRQDTGAKLLIGALGFFLVAVLHDIAASQFGIKWLRLTAFGTFVFMSCCCLLVGRRVADALSLNQTLAEEKRILENLHTEAVNTARRDHLTGLLNRQAFDQEYDLAWRTANAKTEPLSVILFDIDHFKQVNDTYGHAIGDRVLQGLADLLAHASMRRHDRVCRYGGEEFVLILPNTLLEDALAVAENLRKEIAETQMIDDPDFGLSVTCSFGVACTITASGCSADLLLQRADEALYVSKDSGRNQVNGVYSLADN
ncbi:MAG: diguanylate cyclase [Shimia sp.]|uniref:diguanylate cyclase n=1 Tax=Shimia sp. TaxID=1954381 RepID=UPI004059A6C0